MRTFGEPSISPTDCNTVLGVRKACPPVRAHGPLEVRADAVADLVACVSAVRGAAAAPRHAALAAIAVSRDAAHLRAGWTASRASSPAMRHVRALHCTTSAATRQAHEAPSPVAAAQAPAPVCEGTGWWCLPLTSSARSEVFASSAAASARAPSSKMPLSVSRRTTHRHALSGTGNKTLALHRPRYTQQATPRSERHLPPRKSHSSFVLSLSASAIALHPSSPILLPDVAQHRHAPPVAVSGPGSHACGRECGSAQHAPRKRSTRTVAFLPSASAMATAPSSPMRWSAARHALRERS
eukprot:scaffold4993_cov211-Prasinococcus_capsulatus_cf.AAC.10